jgi:uncharacterized cupin superfamily protein
MAPGTTTDVEIGEAFIVVSGAGRVEFTDSTPGIDLRPGDLVHLAEGAATTWTVTETLRKIYLCPANAV